MHKTIGHNLRLVSILHSRILREAYDIATWYTLKEYLRSRKGFVRFLRDKQYKHMYMCIYRDREITTVTNSFY